MPKSDWKVEKFVVIPWKRVKHFKKVGGVALAILALISVFFSLYVFRQYRTLEEEFLIVRETLPTRFYSSPKRIFPGLPRTRLEVILKRLRLEPLKNDASEIRIRLNPLSYPQTLIPANHPTLRMENKEISILFEGDEKKSVISKIYGPAQEELPEFYLEPELIATHSRESTQMRTLLSFEEIPAPIWQAILSVEDQHYIDHQGIDPRGLIRAVWVNLRTLSLAQGGSTITQQLVKNLLARRTKNIVRKFSEIFLALILETRFEKERILERYLNEVYLGQIGSLEIHGVGEGAKYFFGKNIQDLNLGEIALIAGVIRGPFYYSPFRNLDRAIQRKNLVLDKMVEVGHLAPDEAEEAKNAPIRLTPPVFNSNRANFFVDYARWQLQKELAGKFSEDYIWEAGLKVFTTLDLDAQSTAEESLERQIASLEKAKNLDGDRRLEGALLSVDPETGNLLAIVGGRDYSKSTFHRVLWTRRQAGSTMKPIVLAAALEKKEDAHGVSYGPAYPVLDAPWTLHYENGKKTWSPKDYEKDFRGWVPLRRALADSLNIPFAKLAWSVGIPRIIELAKRIGIGGEIPQVPSIALGSNEVSLPELAQAYSVFANNGVRPELTSIRAVTFDDGTSFAQFSSRPLASITPDLAFWISDFLRSPLEIGTARSAKALGWDRPSAGKTGTTNDYRDSWFVGYPLENGAVTAVWVGFDRAEAEAGDKEKARSVRLTGSEAALPVWVEVEKTLTEGLPIKEFEWNKYLIEASIDLHSGKRSPLLCPASQVVVEHYARDALGDDVICAETFPKRPED